jgi:hypothetical protein
VSDVTTEADLTEHRYKTGHSIYFSGISLLDKAIRFMARNIKEAIRIKLHHKKFNTGGGFTVSRSWYPVTNLLKQ